MAWKINYTEFDKEQMDVVKAYTKQSTASKAIIYMLSTYVSRCEALKDERQRVLELEMELRNLKSAIKNKVAADKYLIDIIVS